VVFVIIAVLLSYFHNAEARFCLLLKLDIFSPACNLIFYIIITILPYADFVLLTEVLSLVTTNPTEGRKIRLPLPLQQLTVRDLIQRMSMFTIRMKLQKAKMRKLYNFKIKH